MAMKSTAFTEAGSPKINEDAIFFNDDAGICILCDGVGGAGVGSVASKLAIDSIQQYLTNHNDVLSRNRAGATKEERHVLRSLLEKAALFASETIFQAAQKNSSHQGMCTTLDLLLFTPTHLILAHVGSGRVYLVRGGEEHQLTEDHTQLAHLRRLGKGVDDSKEKAALSKRLTKVIGFQPTVKVDLLDVELQTGDRIFACTDGVWLPLPENILEKYVVAQDVVGAAQKLKEEVIRAGAKDNYTLSFMTPQISAPVDAAASAGVKVQLTGKVPIFEFLSYADIIRVLGIADLFKVPSGHLICKEGDAGSEIMLVVQGSVEVQKAGKRLALLGKGDFFGEMGMLGVAPRSATIVAQEATNLLAFPRQPLFELLRQEQDICVKFLWGITQELNKRLRATSSQLVGQQPGASVEKLGPSQLPFLYSLGK